MKTMRMAPDSNPIPTFAERRLAREWKTVTAMICIYCRDQHGGALCAECQDLAGYVRQRLEQCRFGPGKPTCAKCPVHCYQRERRARIKDVMRYAGPRMLWEHPWLSLRHLLDGRLQNRAAAAFLQRKRGEPTDARVGFESQIPGSFRETSNR
jgi:hypothetical protein